MKRLYLSNTDVKIAGVCGGLGEYFEIDPIFIRVLFLAGLIFGGFTLFLYLIMWLVVPRKPE